ncbi:MAG: carboxyl transferase domain-containing protein [Microthrixaceae bacterium]
MTGEWVERLLGAPTEGIGEEPGSPDGTIEPLFPLDESLSAAVVQLDRHPLLVVWCRFDHAAGTLGRVAADRFVAALDHAVTSRLPVLAIANSGGVRMQEGPAAFVRMLDLVAARRRLAAAHLPFVVYLAHPATGGVLASWGSLGDVTWAEPGALVGFTGPRVAEQLGEPILPPESQRAESLYRHGILDAIVAPEDLAARTSKLLSLLARDSGDEAADVDTASAGVDGVGDSTGLRGWEAVTAARGPRDRAVVDGLLGQSFVELSGDKAGSAATDVVVGICRIGTEAAVVLGHRLGARPGVADLRVARRGFEVAESLDLAVVAVIDTAGARLSGLEESSGFAAELARSADRFAALSVPTVTVLGGQGSGGAAMAWFGGRARLALPGSWFGPIAPEAGSLIVHRDTDHAPEIATIQRVGSAELLEAGLIDRIVDEPSLGSAVAGAIARQRR